MEGRLIKKEVLEEINNYVYDIEVDENHNYFANGVLVHNCKSPTSQQGKNLLKLSAPYQLGMTGTVLMNSPQDAYVPLKWIGEEKSTQSLFTHYYCKFGGMFGNELQGYRHLDVLQDCLSKCSLRRKKDLLDLPPKTIIHEYVDMNDAQAKFYDDIKQGIIDEVDKV